MSRTEIVLRVVSFVAMIAGISAVIVFGWIVFVPGEALCDGVVMSPGQTCGLPFAAGHPYESMVTETTVRRGVGYAAWGLAVAGMAGVLALGIYRRRQGPPPSWFAPETVLRGDAGAVTLQVLIRAAAAYGERLADRERAVGPDHPDTLGWRYHLANVSVLAGDTTGAAAHYEAVAAGRARVLGPEHRDTLAADAGVAYAHAMGDEPARAVALCEALLDRAERVLPARDSVLRTVRRTLELARTRVADAGRG